MSTPAEATTWLATYLLHSTLLLGLALVAAPRLRSDAWRETLWRTALLGGLATATLQTTLAYTPVVGRWTLRELGSGEAARTPRAPDAAPVFPPRGEALPPADVYAPDHGGGEGRSAGPASSAAPRAAPVPAAAGELPRSPLPWDALAVCAWAAMAGLLLVRLGIQHALLLRLLRDRRPVTAGGVCRMLAEFRGRAGLHAPVRLSCSAACPTPIALGRAEICVPERFLTDLDPDQQRNALAHELAHLRRRDPMWQLAAGVVESVLCFQPLNRVARRRLRDAAENLCDDWAVRQTGSALGLARCLTDIASWIGPAPLPGSAPAMAAHGSPLLRRVERLVEWREPSSLPPLLRRTASAALLALVAAAAPGISHAGPAESPPARTAAPGGAPVDTNPMEKKPMDTPAPETVAALATPARTAERSPSSDSLIVHADPSAPLAQRWSWALGRDLPGGYWIAWGVEGGVRSPEVVLECPPGGSGCRTVVSEQGAVSSDSHDPAGDSPDAPSLRERVGGAPGGAPPVAFAFRVGSGGGSAGVEWIRLRSAGAPLDLGGRPLVWLGRAGTGESLAQLRGLYRGLGAPALRKQAVAAVALHEGEADVVQTLREVLRTEASAPVRTEAVKWLSRGQRGGAEVFDFLVGTALADPSSDVRHRAVSRLGRIGSPRTPAALVDMALTAPHPDVREEAVDQLAGNREALVRLSREAKDPRVRRDAVKALASGHPEEAVPMLLAVAMDDPVERVRREAAVQLAGFRSDSARRALAQLAAPRPESRARAEAAADPPGSP